MKKVLAVVFASLLMVPNLSFAADFDARQAVRINDGTNDRGVATANPLITRISDGTDLIEVNADGSINAANASAKATDSVAGATDDVVPAGAIRDDVLTTLTPADGDYVGLRTTSTGALWVETTGSMSGAPSEPDDSAFVVATDNVSPAGYLADDTATDSVDEGDVGLARMTLDRKQLMVLADPTTDANRLAINGSGAASVNVTNTVISVDDNASSLTVDGTVTANLSAVDNAVLDQIELNTDFGTVVGGGTEATALRVTVANDSTGLLSIDDNGASITVDASQLDIDDLDSGTDSVSVLQATHDNLNANANIQVGDADVSLTNAVPVIQGEPTVSANEVHDFEEEVDTAKNVTTNHDYTVTGTTFFLTQVSFSASSNAKMTLSTGPIAGLVTQDVSFISASNPTYTVTFDPPIEVPATGTGTVRLALENKDNTTQSIYSRISGYDI